jgi:hypothetical protein
MDRLAAIQAIEPTSGPLVRLRSQVEPPAMMTSEVNGYLWQTRLVRLHAHRVNLSQMFFLCCLGA